MGAKTTKTKQSELQNGGERGEGPPRRLGTEFYVSHAIFFLAKKDKRFTTPLSRQDDIVFYSGYERDRCRMCVRACKCMCHGGYRRVSSFAALVFSFDGSDDIIATEL